MWRLVVDTKYDSLGEVGVLRRLWGPMLWECGNV
jgi:hypothetical protein